MGHMQYETEPAQIGAEIPRILHGSDQFFSTCLEGITLFYPTEYSDPNGVLPPKRLLEIADPTLSRAAVTCPYRGIEAETGGSTGIQYEISWSRNWSEPGEEEAWHALFSIKTMYGASFNRTSRILLNLDTGEIEICTIDGVRVDDPDRQKAFLSQFLNDAMVEARNPANTREVGFIGNEGCEYESHTEARSRRPSRGGSTEDGLKPFRSFVNGSQQIQASLGENVRENKGNPFREWFDANPDLLDQLP